MKKEMGVGKKIGKGVLGIFKSVDECINKVIIF